MKDLTKLVRDSLDFLNNQYIRFGLMSLLILYIAGVIPMLTPEVSNIFSHPIANVFFIFLVLYLSAKDLPLALLLALAFVLSVQRDSRNRSMFMGGDMAEAEETGEGMNEAGNEGFGNEDGPEGGNYNDFSDCVSSCASGSVGHGPLSGECNAVTGLSANELNAQGLNCPLGFSGSKVAAPF